MANSIAALLILGASGEVLATETELQGRCEDPDAGLALLQQASAVSRSHASAGSQLGNASKLDGLLSKLDGLTGRSTGKKKPGASGLQAGAAAAHKVTANTDPFSFHPAAPTPPPAPIVTGDPNFAALSSRIAAEQSSMKSMESIAKPTKPPMDATVAAHLQSGDLLADAKQKLALLSKKDSVPNAPNDPQGTTSAQPVQMVQTAMPQAPFASGASNPPVASNLIQGQASQIVGWDATAPTAPAASGGANPPSLSNLIQSQVNAFAAKIEKEDEAKIQKMQQDVNAQIKQLQMNLEQDLQRQIGEWASGGVQQQGVAPSGVQQQAVALASTSQTTSNQAVASPIPPIMGQVSAPTVPTITDQFTVPTMPPLSFAGRAS